MLQADRRSLCANHNHGLRMDEIDRQLVNALQDGIEVIDRPFAGLAASFTGVMAKLEKLNS